MRFVPGLCAVCVLSVVIATDVIWLLAAGISITVSDPRVGFLLLVPVTYALLSRLLLLRSHPLKQVLRRFENALLGLVLFAFAWMAATMLCHLMMTTRFPYADAVLAAWDERLGFNWRHYFRFVVESPEIRFMLAPSYNLFKPASLIAFLVLALSENPRRATFLFEAFFISSVLCILIGAFFPAEGATAHYLRATVPDDMVRYLPGLYHLDALQWLREGQVVTIDPTRLPGLVTFPSFHTAGGIVVATAFWRTRWFIPVAVYTVCMIASTPIYGAHYAIDLVAGAVVAVAVMIALGSLSCYRGVLGRAPVGAPDHV